MRLFEIIKHTYTQDRREFAPDERERDSGESGEEGSTKPTSDGDELESGSFSFVKPDVDPHMIRKYHKRDHYAETDGFVLYAEYLASKELWNKNIHFPRVYNTNQDPGYGDAHDWLIEVLVPWNYVSEKEYQAMFRRYFTGEGVERRMILDNTALYAVAMSTMISTVCGEYGLNEDIQVKDEELAEAIRLLTEFADSSSAELDLHKNNIMYRRTSVGMQVVLSDPFGYTF